jgi:hypothetical protein
MWRNIGGLTSSWGHHTVQSVAAGVSTWLWEPRPFSFPEVYDIAPEAVRCRVDRLIAVPRTKLTLMLSLSGRYTIGYSRPQIPALTAKSWQILPSVSEFVAIPDTTLSVPGLTAACQFRVECDGTHGGSSFGWDEIQHFVYKGRAFQRFITSFREQEISGSLRLF